MSLDSITPAYGTEFSQSRELARVSVELLGEQEEVRETHFAIVVQVAFCRLAAPFLNWI